MGNSVTFGNEFGSFLFVWGWAAAIVGHCSFMVVVFGKIEDDVGADDTTRVIVELLNYGQLTEAEQLYEFGVPIGAGNNILHALCWYGRIDGMDWIKRVCVSHPQYINSQNTDVMTPIMRCRDEIIIRYLLERGARMNIYSLDNQNLLHYFCKDAFGM